MDETDCNMVCNDSEEDGVVRRERERERNEGTACEDGDSSTDC